MYSRFRIDKKTILGFKELLKEKGLSQADLARQMGMSASNLSKVLSGSHQLKDRVAWDIFEYLDLDPRADYLVRPKDFCLDRVSNPDDHWRMLYQGHSELLESAYMRVSPEIKGAVLGGLEELLRECGKKEV